jgi:hypothetical protein
MNRSAEAPAFVVEVNPRRSLVRNGVLSYALLSLPLFGALYFFSSSSAVGFTVLGVHLLTLAIFTIVYLRFMTVFIGVTSTAIYERSFLGAPKVMWLSKVGHATLVYTYRSSSTEAVPQLLVRCVDNTRVLRMRGIFWSEADMRAVGTVIATSAGIQLIEHEEPITANTFFTEYPGSAYWFENRPALIVVAVFVTLLAVLGIVLAFMALMGIPIDRV